MAIVEGLRDGWEPDTDSSDTIVLAAARAMGDRAAAWASAAGGRIERDDGLELADAGSANLFVNQGMATRPLDPEMGRRVLDFYSEGQPFVLMSPRPSADLRPLGLGLMGHPPFMVRSASAAGSTDTPGPTEPPWLHVVELTDQADLPRFAEIAAAGFGLPASPVPAGLLGGPHRFWLAYRDGVPAGVSAAYVGHGVVDVEAVATLPGHRGHGVGEAVTWAATRAEASLPAVLIASDLGRAIYQRMGYLPISRWTIWYRD